MHAESLDSFTREGDIYVLRFRDDDGEPFQVTFGVFEAVRLFSLATKLMNADAVLQEWST